MQVLLCAAHSLFDHHRARSCRIVWHLNRCVESLRRTQSLPSTIDVFTVECRLSAARKYDLWCTITLVTSVTERSKSSVLQPVMNCILHIRSCLCGSHCFYLSHPAIMCSSYLIEFLVNFITARRMFARCAGVIECTHTDGAGSGRPMIQPDRYPHIRNANKRNWCWRWWWWCILKCIGCVCGCVCVYLWVFDGLVWG